MASLCYTHTREKLLSHASTLAPFMTFHEFGTVSRIAAIFLLGFLIPTSTGNDFFTDVTGDAFIGMPLEERLERCSRFYVQGEFGGVCVDPTREEAFRSFLEKGVAPLLAARPAHSTKTDLLHLFAMAISSQPQDTFIQETTKVLKEKDSSNWIRAQQLMDSIHTRSFHVNDSHRLKLVKILSRQLVLPKQAANATSFADDPLMSGAVPHLRAALHSFAMTRSAVDAHEARKALVNIAVRTGDKTTVWEEWESLVRLTSGSDTYCRCSCGIDGIKGTRSFCSHAARGKLMEHFIQNYNGSRHYADGSFTTRAFKSLNNYIQQSLQESPCLLVSLLMTCRSVFYFLLPETDGDESVTVKQSRDEIIRATIQLLRHPSVCVTKAASSLLALALSYNSSELSVAYVQGVEKCIEMALNPSFENAVNQATENRFDSFADIVTTLSRMSPTFGADMLEYLLGKLQKNTASSVAAYRMIVTIATARPFAAQKQVDSILLLTKATKDVDCKGQLAVTLMNLRQAHLFAKDDREDVQTCIGQIISEISDQWVKYKLACQALITGNVNIASDIFESILSLSSSGDSYLWISALSKICMVENEITTKGCHGILTATPSLYTAISYLESLTETVENDFGFQIEYLRLRIDFLEQCMSLHNICKEIRLSGTVPKTTVRTGLHLRNTIKLFYSLAGRYFSLYKRYGLFLSQQSLTALRTCHAICRWLGDACRKGFPEVTPKAEMDSDETWPHGDKLAPSSLLLKRLNKVVFDSLDASLDPQIRGAAMTETLDAILLTPYPFPRGLTTIKNMMPSNLMLSVDRSESDDSTNDTHDCDLHVYPRTIFTVLASGKISLPTVEKANLPFFRILLWFNIRLIDAEAVTEGRIEISGVETTEDSIGNNPVEISLLPCGRFVAPLQCQAPLVDGAYIVEATLGCRDVRGGEWELPVEPHTTPLLIRVSS